MATLIFQTMGQSFDNATAHFVTATSARLITDFTPIAMTGVGLFMTCYGYLIMVGRVQEPFTEFLLKCTKIIIIASLALNTTTYLDWIVTAINGLQEGLASALAQANSTSTIYQTLDQMFDKGIGLIQQCVEKARNADWYAFGEVMNWYINASLIAMGTLVIVLTGGFIILTASILLKLMLAIGPIFIMCLMWPMTAKFFDAWFGQTLIYIFKMVFVATIMAFAIKIFESIINGVDLNSTQSTIQMMLEITVTSFLLYKVVLEVGGVSAALAGGIAASAMTIGQLASSAMAPTKNVKAMARGTRNAIDPISTRRDLQSGMLASDRRSGHVLAGNTLLNPAYRQKLVENIGKNWGRKQGGRIEKS